MNVIHLYSSPASAHQRSGRSGSACGHTQLYPQWRERFRTCRGGACLVHGGRGAHVRTCSPLQAIGFELGGPADTNKGTEKHAGDLTRSAASVLLYQQVLKEKPGQLFLKLLLLLQRGGRTTDTLETYAELWQQLQNGGSASWQDYLLEQVLRGANPFAKAASRGTLLPPGSPMHKAAAYDLDVLQKLAVPEPTLVSWIVDACADLPKEWAETAQCMGPSLMPPADILARRDPRATEAPDFSEQPPPPPEFLLAPPSLELQHHYRCHIGGQWKWSQALPCQQMFLGSCTPLQHRQRVCGNAAFLRGLKAGSACISSPRLSPDTAGSSLEYYHRSYGFGLTAGTSILEWSGSNLAAVSIQQDNGHVKLTGDSSRLHDTLKKFAEQTSSVGGVCEWGSDPPAALSDAVLAVGQGQGLRVMQLSAQQFCDKLTDIGFYLGSYPRVKFVVIVQGDDSSLVSLERALQAVTSGSPSAGWPTNALILPTGF